VTDVPAAVSPPQQERSRASFERLLEAGTGLLEERGYEGFTLAEVSRRAGVSIGSIYARVKSKDDLFAVIQNRFMSATEADSPLERPGSWEDLPSYALVMQIVSALAANFQRNAPLLRVFMHRGIVDGIAAARSSRSMSRFSEQMETLLLTRRGEILHPDPELAVSVAFRMVWGTMASHVTYWPTVESHGDVAWDALVVELGNACAAYLFGVPGEAATVLTGDRGSGAVAGRGGGE
jgi:AcrR family transcriptional regulator